MNFDVTPELPRGFIGGLQISNGTDSDHDIDIAVGECRGQANDGNLELTSALTKQIDASWAAGTNAGGMANGVSLSTNTWYHVFLVDDGSGGTDAGFDTDIAATNLLATTGVGTIYRRIGSVKTDGSSNILAFDQLGDLFSWSVWVEDINAETINTTAEDLTLASVPTGLRVEAHISGWVSNATDSEICFIYPDAVTDTALVAGQPPVAGGGAVSGAGDFDNFAIGPHFVPTTTAQVVRVVASGTQTLDLTVLGWRDPLGRWG